MKIINESSLEDCLAEFSWRYKEVFSSLGILREALANDMNGVTIEQVGDMIEILFERMEDNTLLFEKILSKSQEYFLKLQNSGE